MKKLENLDERSRKLENLDNQDFFLDGPAPE
jgi:hypothetical protein